jgi:enolase
LRFGAETFQSRDTLLHEKGLSTAVGDEGGFAPHLSSNEEACDLIVTAIECAGYRPGEDIAIALDPAASSFCANGAYHLTRGGRGEHTASDMIALYSRWCAQYSIVSIEDGLG